MTETTQEYATRLQKTIKLLEELTHGELEVLTGYVYDQKRKRIEDVKRWSSLN